MPRIQRIASYICMFQVIFLHFESKAAKVSMNPNMTGLLGNTDTHLTCSFDLKKGEDIISVQINAKNITENFDDKNLIAIFEPEIAAKLLHSGTYLTGRVTLTNITNTSTNATLTFHRLKSIDEKDYMCKFFYYDKVKVIKIRESKATRISVKVQVRDVHIKNKPNQKQYGKQTDNITLTCKADGDPDPTYTWFKEDNNCSLLSRTNVYVIEDVIRNNSGLYICQAYNSINNITYSHSSSVIIDIVDELLSSPGSVSSKISAASYAVPIFLAVIICLAVIYRKYCSKQAQIEKNEESRWQNMIGYFISSCTRKPVYTTVVRNTNNDTEESEDIYNGLKNPNMSCRNKYG